MTGLFCAYIESTTVDVSSLEATIVLVHNELCNNIGNCENKTIKEDSLFSNYTDCQGQIQDFEKERKLAGCK